MGVLPLTWSSWNHQPSSNTLTHWSHSHARSNVCGDIAVEIKCHVIAKWSWLTVAASMDAPAALCTNVLAIVTYCIVVAAVIAIAKCICERTHIRIRNGGVAFEERPEDLKAIQLTRTRSLMSRREVVIRGRHVHLCLLLQQALHSQWRVHVSCETNVIFKMHDRRI